MPQERRVFVSVDLPANCHPDIDRILGVAATWLPGNGAEKHPQLRVSPDWPIKELWRAYAPLISESWIHEFSDPNGEILILPPGPEDVLPRLAELRARFPEAGIRLHVVTFLCEQDSQSGSYLSPEVMLALAKAGVTFAVSTHYDRTAADQGGPDLPTPFGSSPADHGRGSGSDGD